MTALRNQANPVKESVEIAEMYQRGLRGLSALSESERFHFNSISVGFYRVFEEAFLHHKEGRLEEAYWNSLSGQLEEVLGVNGIREDWEAMMGDDDEVIKAARNNFDPEFVSFVHNVVRQHGPSL